MEIKGNNLCDIYINGRDKNIYLNYIYPDCMKFNMNYMDNISLKMRRLPNVTSQFTIQSFPTMVMCGDSLQRKIF